MNRQTRARPREIRGLYIGAMGEPVVAMAARRHDGRRLICERSAAGLCRRLLRIVTREAAAILTAAKGEWI